MRAARESQYQKTCANIKVLYGEWPTGSSRRPRAAFFQGYPFPSFKGDQKQRLLESPLSDKSTAVKEF